MVSLLTPAQRSDLNRSIIGYIRAQGVSEDAVERLSHELGVSAKDEDDKAALERKWAALTRLQRKLLDLEQQNEALQRELKESARNEVAAPAGNSSGSKLDNWLPHWPPALTLEGHRGRVTCVAFSSKWQVLASGSEDGLIKLWDVTDGEIERTVKAHTRSVQAVAFAPRSNLLVSASADLSVRVWDPAKNMANIQTLLGHDHTVSAVTVILDPNTRKEYIASASRDKTIRVWDLELGFVVGVIRTHTDWVRALDATKFEDGNVQWLLSVSSDRTARLTKLFSDGTLGERGSDRVFHGHKHVIECCAIAPKATAQFVAKLYTAQGDDILFATGGRDSMIYIWASSETEKPILQLRGHDNWVQGVVFHPSGRFLISVSDDKTMRVWDLPTARLVKTIPAHNHFVTSITWAGRGVATGSVDETIRLWRG